MYNESEYQKEYRKKHKIEKAEYEKKYAKEHRNNIRKGHWRRKYGITEDEYNLKFLEQAGKCAICGKHQSEFKRALSVDHDHATGKVRGLLCYNCNTGLGMFKEDTKILDIAIDYLGKEG